MRSCITRIGLEAADRPVFDRKGFRTRRSVRHEPLRFLPAHPGHSSGDEPAGSGQRQMALPLDAERLPPKPHIYHATSNLASHDPSVPTHSCQLRLKTFHFCRSKISHFERAVVPPDAVFWGVGLCRAVGNRVGAATAKSLAATTRLSTAGGCHRSCLRLSRRSRGGSFPASIRTGLEQVLMILHPVAVAPDVDDVAVVHKTVDESRRHDLVA